MAGLGFAPEQAPAPSPGATARAPQIDTLGPTQPRRAAPLAHLTPMQKVGALLQDFGRGVAGQPSYTDQLIAQRAETEKLELERMNIGGKALSKGMELLKNTPAGQREGIAKQFGAMYEHLMPGFTDTLMEAAQQPEATAAQLAALGEHAQTLISIGGSMEKALELAQKPEFMKQLNEQADTRNAPEITRALDRGMKELVSTPEGKALWDRVTADGFTLSDLQDPQVQQGLGLTQGHVNSIARNKELQSSLRAFGFKPLADADLEAKEKITTKSLDRIAAEAAAGESARQAQKMITYVGSDGTIVRDKQGNQDARAAQGFRPLVTGRTDADERANKALQKHEDADAVPVDPVFARLAGVDPSTTRGDAVKNGLTPDLDDTTKRNLQGAEAGTRNLQGIVGQMREIIKSNPDANTRMAALGGLITNIRSELDSLGKATGVKIDVDRELKGREEIFKANGIDNAVMKQLAISLAYMNAKSLDETGRLSDSDVRNSAKAIGAGAANPDILLALIDQAELTADSSFRNRVQAATGARRPSGLPDIQAAEDIATRVEAGEEPTPEEIAALTPRARRELKARLSSGK